MIAGVRIEEKPSSAAVAPGDRESDGGDDLSHYSSCGESEFERYCSASSAMGTPSFRGSSFHDSDFGSLKGFKLGGDVSDFNKINGADRVLSDYRKSESGSGGNELCSDEKENGGFSLNGAIEGYVVGGGVDLRGNFDLEGNWGSGVMAGSEMNGVIDGEGRRFHVRVEKASDSGEGLKNDGGEDRNSLDEAESSSRGEHSEGEDSMFGCGSDDERRVDFYYGKTLPFRGEGSGRKENRMAMNSAVAFGADDWDDFAANTDGPMVWGEFQSESKTVAQSGTGSSSFTAGNSVTHSNTILTARKDNARGAPQARNQVESDAKLPEINVERGARSEDSKIVIASRNQVGDIDELDEYLGSVASVNDIFQIKKEPLEKVSAKEEVETELKTENRNVTAAEAVSIHEDITLKKSSLEEETNIEMDPTSDFAVKKNDVVAVKVKEEEETRLAEDSSSSAFPLVADTRRSVPTKTNLSPALDPVEDHFVPNKKRDFELNEFYDEFVNDMEDILLDSAESPASRLNYSSRISQSQLFRPSRDGGSSASTSGTDYPYNQIHQPLKIDRVEVVGARQIKGDVTLSERLVGGQKHTVYKIKVWSGQEQWEVERRYRDFQTLYHRLQKLFSDNGWTLPSPWFSVEKESKKYFGNASPNVVADRSVLIQECLQSIIHHRFPSSSINALTCFLSCSEMVPSSPAPDTGMSESPVANRSMQKDEFSTLGKTISLVVQTRPLKSMKRILDEQHYRCAGCHRNFDDGRTKMQELVLALGWGKPRLCEYSGQLFCSSCHTNDTAVLPAKVLHYWDFSRYPVSQLAKSFLDSIYDQPMLCVSAVNPSLFSRVPTLQHVANVRNRIRVLLPYVQCQFRESVSKGLGSRSYILESNDFFALKDLIDLSKGVFSALPVMVEAVSRKIQKHITDQCLVCYDAGVPCGSRKDCQDPLALIFPFQEEEVEKCRSCELVFHKNCFKELATCPCGARFKQEEMRSSGTGIQRADSNSITVAGKAESGSGILASLFSKVLPMKPQIPRKLEAEGSGNVISMGSLPSTNL